MAELAGIILREDWDINKKLDSLDSQAQKMLDNLKTDLAKNVSTVDTCYAEKINTFKSLVKKYQSTLEEDENVCETRNGTLSSRIAKHKTENNKLKNVLAVAETLIEIENGLKSPPENLIEKTQLFVKTQKLLESFDNTKLENLALVRGYAMKLRAVCPTTEINKQWFQLAVINENEILCPTELREMVKASELLDKLLFFTEPLYKALNSFIICDRVLIFENQTLKKTSESRNLKTLHESLVAIKQFLVHLEDVGLGPTHSLADKLLDNICVTFLRKGLPSTQMESSSIKISIDIVLSLKPILRIDLEEVIKFSEDLPNLMKTSAIAKTLECARVIIMDKNPELLEETFCEHDGVGIQEATLAKYVKNNGDVLAYQNKKYPISLRCKKIWELMTDNPNTAPIMSILYMTIMRATYSITFDVSLHAACLYYSDLQWLIGGLSSLSTHNHFSQYEKLKIVAYIPKLQNASRSVLDIHMQRTKQNIDAMMCPELPNIVKISDQCIFDEVARSLRKSIQLVNTTLNEMRNYLPEAQIIPFATLLTKIIHDSLFTTITGLVDITSNLCTPMDNLIALCGELPLYGKLHFEDLRFMLRSSLAEITASFESGELEIQAPQIRSLIRALFSNTDHRQNALAKIK